MAASGRGLRALWQMACRWTRLDSGNREGSMSGCRLWLEEMRVGWLVQGSFLQGLQDQRALLPRQKDRACSPLKVFCVSAFAPRPLVVWPPSRGTAQRHATHCPKLRTSELSLSRRVRAFTAGRRDWSGGLSPRRGRKCRSLLECSPGDSKPDSFGYSDFLFFWL